MKKLVLATTLCLLTSESFAGSRIVKSIEESQALIETARVADSIVLGANKEKDVTVRLVSEYLGQATDIAPKKNLYLTYFHGGELNNTRTAFELGAVWELKSTKRLSAGVYQIKYVDMDLKARTMTVDTTQVTADDNKLKLEEFESPYFKSTIKISE